MLCLQSKEIALDVRVVYIYMKSRIFGRGKPLTGPETAAKLQVSTPKVYHIGGNIRGRADRQEDRLPPLASSIGHSQFSESMLLHTENCFKLTAFVSSQIKYLYDQKALLDQLESSNVTTDLGGALCYDHKNWVHNRLVC